MNRTATIPQIVIMSCLTCILAGKSAGANDLQDACALMRQRLDMAPRRPPIYQVQGHFDDPFKTDGNGQYYGCIISLSGDTRKTPTSIIKSLFETGEKGVSALGGWTTDSTAQADGPDGTVFKITKGPIFWFIEGRWDGGDDSNDDYQPSTEFKYTVSCAQTPE
ncbi:MAG: hypothetical protein ACYC9J_11570 [Sulfuricaulis sp.]